MPSRDGAVARARAAFDSGAFRDRLAALVAIPSTSQEPAHAPALRAYLEDGLAPWLRTLGFGDVAIDDNPEPGVGPILTAARIEDPSRPTILVYGHSNRMTLQAGGEVRYPSSREEACTRSLGPD